jgi:hypothetical protein
MTCTQVPTPDSRFNDPCQPYPSVLMKVPRKLLVECAAELLRGCNHSDTPSAASSSDVHQGPTSPELPMRSDLPRYLKPLPPTALLTARSSSQSARVYDGALTELLGQGSVVTSGQKFPRDTRASCFSARGIPPEGYRSESRGRSSVRLRPIAAGARPKSVGMGDSEKGSKQHSSPMKCRQKCGPSVEVQFLSEENRQQRSQSRRAAKAPDTEFTSEENGHQRSQSRRAAKAPDTVEEKPLRPRRCPPTMRSVDSEVVVPEDLYARMQMLGDATKKRGAHRLEDGAKQVLRTS